MSRGFGKPETRDSALVALKKSYAEFWKLIQKQIAKLNSDEADRDRFSALLGTTPLGGQLRLSDLLARYAFAKFVIDELQHLNQVSDDLDFYHLTLLAEEGDMSDREPLFALRLLKRKADKAMRKAGLDGIYVIEVQPLMNWPQKGEGRTLLAHVHVLGWKKNSAPDNSAADIRRALGYDRRRRNLAWSSHFGADPIVVRHLTLEKGCPSFWAAYLLKVPHNAKSRVPRKNYEATSGKSEFKLRTTSLGYRPELAMRLLELFAQLPIFATIGGVGSGAAILGRCKNRLKLWDAQRQAGWKKNGLKEVPPFDEVEFWQHTHKRRKARYLSFFIDGPTVAPRIRRQRR